MSQKPPRLEERKTLSFIKPQPEYDDEWEYDEELFEIEEIRQARERSLKESNECGSVKSRKKMNNSQGFSEQAKDLVSKASLRARRSSIEKEMLEKMMSKIKTLEVRNQELEDVSKQQDDLSTKYQKTFDS